VQIPAQDELDRLCGPGNWQIIGVSALVYDASHVYLEITKPSYWQTASDGRIIVPLGGIGGMLDPGEELLDCLAREAAEELGVSLRIVGAAGTRLIRGGTLLPGSHTDGDKPYPLLYTIGQNRRVEPAQRVGWMVIATYLAEALEAPMPHDLFGLLAVPRGRLDRALPKRPLTLDALCTRAGAELILNGEAPPGALVKPILTAESIRLLLAEDWPLPWPRLRDQGAVRGGR
jgi:hypothetical protein